MKYLRQYLVPLAALVVVSGVFFTIYVVAQQVLRMDANDPQIQLAEDAAAKLDAGADPAAVVGPRVDIAKSLVPWVVVYKRGGSAAASSAYWHNSVPPQFWTAQEESGLKEHAVTIEPYSGLRFATVAVPAKNYVVLSGRSLLEVEKRENVVGMLSLLGWLGAASVILIASWLSARRQKK